MNDKRRYFGKYRGTVTSNMDPRQMGRIMATVPDVTGTLPGTWALPCMPSAANKMGLLSPPPRDSLVWIEYEQGDPDFPVWVGCFWGSAAELPTLPSTVPATIPSITLQTTAGNGIVISDMAGEQGGIQIKAASGAKICVTDTGITIDNGQGAVVKLTSKTVTINNDGLSVT